MSKWIKQRERTFPMHGIRRALWWRKDLYREWFEYAKLSGKYPKQFGNLNDYEFDVWWKTKELGFDLFCEPYIEDKVKTVNATIATDQKRHVLLDINLDDDIDHLLQLVKRELKKKNPKPYEKSRAQYVPSKDAKDLRIYENDYRSAKRTDMTRRLANPRLVHAMTEDGLDNLDIAYKMSYIDKAAYSWANKIRGLRGNKRLALEVKAGPHPKNIDAAFRRIARDRKRCKEMFVNIAKGTFP